VRSNGVRVVIADDRELLREGLRALLVARPEFDVVGVRDDGPGAVQMCREQAAEVLLIGSGMIDEDLLRRSGALRACHPAFRLIILDECVEPGRRVPWPESDADVRVPVSATLAALTNALRGNAGRGASRLSDLTAREDEVVVLVARALTNKQIAHRLGIAPGTVKRHVSNVMAKLGAVSRLDIVNRVR
jgi:two-component system nitrate/nitrite response regulator NarL